MAEKYPPYPAYQAVGSNWLDSIPIYWGERRLKHISPKIGVGLVINPSTYTRDEGVYFIFGSDVKERGFDLEGARRISQQDSDSLKSSRLNAGDLLSVRVGDPGVTAVVPPELEGANCASVVIIRQGNFDSDWLCFAMNSIMGRLQVGLASYGAAQKQFNVSDAVEFKFPVPPLEEQTQIAKFLDYETAKIDALIAKQQQLIALLQEKRQAVISHAVTKGLNPAAPLRDSGVEWLGQVPAHWKVSQLKQNTAQMQTGPFGSQLHAEDYIQGGIPLVNPIHIVNGRIIPESNCSVDSKTYERLARHKLRTGDIIFARRGELGRCAVVREEQDGWLCGSGSLRATLLDRLSPEYAFVLISSSGVRSELALESRGSTMDNLNTDTLGRVRLPVPPLDEQMAILQHIEQVSGQFDKLEKLAVSQSELLQERRTALISAAVTGKIDVRGWQPPVATPAGAGCDEPHGANGG